MDACAVRSRRFRARPTGPPRLSRRRMRTGESNSGYKICRPTPPALSSGVANQIVEPWQRRRRQDAGRLLEIVADGIENFGEAGCAGAAPAGAAATPGHSTRVALPAVTRAGSEEFSQHLLDAAVAMHNDAFVMIEGMPALRDAVSQMCEACWKVGRAGWPCMCTWPSSGYHRQLCGLHAPAEEDRRQGEPRGRHGRVPSLQVSAGTVPQA